MSKRYEIRREQFPKQISKSLGWVEIYEDQSIEWEFDEDSDYYPHFRKLFYELENDKVTLRGNYTSEKVGEDGNGDPLYGEVWEEGGIREVKGYIDSNLPGSITNIVGIGLYEE